MITGVRLLRAQSVSTHSHSAASISRQPLERLSSARRFAFVPEYGFLDASGPAVVEKAKWLAARNGSLHAPQQRRPPRAPHEAAGIARPHRKAMVRLQERRLTARSGRDALLCRSPRPESAWCSDPSHWRTCSPSVTRHSIRSPAIRSGRARDPRPRRSTLEHREHRDPLGGYPRSPRGSRRAERARAVPHPALGAPSWASARWMPAEVPPTAASLHNGDSADRPEYRPTTLSCGSHTGSLPMLPA